MKRIVLLLLLSAQFAGAQQIALIPQPQSLSVTPGSVAVQQIKIITAPNAAAVKANIFSNLLQEKTGVRLPVKITASAKPLPGSIHIGLLPKEMAESEKYILQIKKEQILVNATPGGTMPALQTLLQLFPAKGTGSTLPLVTINDAPRFKYRGIHFDVARHFFPVTYVKKYIDYLSAYKFNTFHWHLTDDQGWRIEIKKHPELTRTGAWRSGTIIGRYPGTGNDNIKHGGFYSQEEIKEVVQYATDRGITVIPEIEMPGHASAALAAYPELGCTGGPYKVQQTWGVFEEVFCAGNDNTFTVLQDVLDEVMKLFPSKYIHIGGDECPKESWKKCTRCQQRMKTEGLKDEHELQSYFIRRMEKYLNGKGRNIIGWDEILEGGLAPNATVMSWRGEEGGIAAAKEHHNVIMTPGSHCYFDHSQSRIEDSVTIGGYTPIEKVYAYEPVPAVLKGDLEKYVLGAQANLWTEYIGSAAKVEYMLFPRILALSEVLWSPGEKREWSDFEKRLINHFAELNRQGINYSRALNDLAVRVEPGVTPGTVKAILAARQKTGLIVHEYVNGVSADEIPYNKTDALLLNTNGEGYENISVTSRHRFTWRGANDSSRPITLRFRFNQATGQKLTLAKNPSPKYPGDGGSFGLVNGLVSERGFASPEWLAWEGGDMEATIDLGRVRNITGAGVHTFEQKGSWIYLPKQVEVEVSENGENFISMGQSDSFMNEAGGSKILSLRFNETPARFIKIRVKNYGQIPSGQPGAGHPAWLFIDEAMVW